MEVLGGNRSAEQAVLQNFVIDEMMPAPSGFVAWDLGCGEGTFSEALADMGASAVLASDLALPPSRPIHPKIQFVAGDFDAADLAIGGLHKVDFVLMHLMSEHVLDLPGFLKDLRSRLRSGVDILIHHDNYLQPVGHHNNGLIALNELTWEIERKGPACWDSPDKCQASAERRARLRADLGLV